MECIRQRSLRILAPVFMSYRLHREALPDWQNVWISNLVDIRDMQLSSATPSKIINIYIKIYITT